MGCCCMDSVKKRNTILLSLKKDQTKYTWYYAKQYLDYGWIGETWFVLKKFDKLVFIRSVVQLAYEFSSFQMTHIDGHTIRLHITHHSAAPFISHLSAPDHVISHCRVCYWFLKYDAAKFVICRRNWKPKVPKFWRSDVIVFIFLKIYLFYFKFVLFNLRVVNEFSHCLRN